jgi:uncharacterized protein YbjT (DUF2867 family)
MKVAIAGGHGKIALHLTRLLDRSGDEVVSLIRNPDHSADIRDAGGEPVVCDLESATVGELAEALGDADAVVFAAGAGPGSGPERRETVDYGGAAKLIEAARATGIDRYLIVSSIGADPWVEGEDTFAVYLQAKGRADDAVARSGLQYTIVRPSRLSDEPGTGRVEAAEHVERREIPREDVAAVLAAALADPATIGKTFELTGGEVPVEEAIASL